MLGAQITPLNTIAYRKEQLHLPEVDGYVDLYWCFVNNSTQAYNTRFVVTSAKDPPYDAVLGKRYAKHYGMLGEKTWRQRNNTRLRLCFQNIENIFSLTGLRRAKKKGGIPGAVTT